ncbi:taurine catabolism dioxygenase TauD, TfdA family-domain-containing protein [Xylariomycetidae sp. FL2044]|nr:taurine catabolism dioxygenase TauD, TfdA family-domain-containing protein [Xylariomycetidae sp. FL2044]
MCEVPHDTPIEHIEFTEAGDLEISWGQDTFSDGMMHHSRYPARFFEFYRRGTAAVDVRVIPTLLTPRQNLWDKKRMEASLHSIDFKDWVLGSGRRFHLALESFHLYGLIFISGIPQEVTHEQLAAPLGPLKSTVWGRQWDIKHIPGHRTIAHGHGSVPLQTQLPFFNIFPRVMLLRCIENNVSGGEVTFSDGLRPAWQLYHFEHEKYKILRDKKIRYLYKNNGNHFSKGRQIIDDPRGYPEKIVFSPTFEDPVQSLGRYRNLSAQQSAWDGFTKPLKAPENVFEHKLKPGECAVVDNWRIATGRRSFDPSTGSRHLQAGYIDIDNFMNTARRCGISDVLGDTTIGTPFVDQLMELDPSLQMVSEEDIYNPDHLTRLSDRME